VKLYTMGLLGPLSRLDRADCLDKGTGRGFFRIPAVNPDIQIRAKWLDLSVVVTSEFLDYGFHPVWEAELRPRWDRRGRWICELCDPRDHHSSLKHLIYHHSLSPLRSWIKDVLFVRDAIVFFRDGDGNTWEELADTCDLERLQQNPSFWKVVPITPEPTLAETKLPWMLIRFRQDLVNRLTFRYFYRLVATYQRLEAGRQEHSDVLSAAVLAVLRRRRSAWKTEFVNLALGVQYLLTNSVSRWWTLELAFVESLDNIGLDSPTPTIERWIGFKLGIPPVLPASFQGNNLDAECSDLGTKMSENSAWAEPFIQFMLAICPKGNIIQTDTRHLAEVLVSRFED